MKLSIFNPKQIDEITQLFRKTFTDSEGQEEGDLIGNLSYELMTDVDESDCYVFVATDDGEAVGSIIFSRLSFENGQSAFLLGPVAIDTNHQGNGIGQKLISYGLSELKKNGTELAITYGDPKFYSKVGFEPVSEDIIKAPLKLSYPHGWLAQSLVGDKIEPIKANSHCVEVFNKPEYW